MKMSGCVDGTKLVGFQFCCWNQFLSSWSLDSISVGSSIGFPLVVGFFLSEILDSSSGFKLDRVFYSVLDTFGITIIFRSVLKRDPKAQDVRSQ